MHQLNSPSQDLESGAPGEVHTSSIVEFGQVVSFIESTTQQTLISRFDSIAEKFPDSPSICGADQSLTFQELQDRINSLAARIADRNLNRKQPIAICVPQGIGFVVSILAAMKAGHFWTPLDPAIAAARNQHILSDSDASLVLVSEESLAATDLFSDGKIETLSIDGTVEALSTKFEPSLPTQQTNDIAFILYTSGSTGNPKGVIHTHRSFLHNVKRHSESFDFTPHDRTTLLYPCTVYGGIRDIFNALLNGASLHHYPLNQRGLTDLADWLVESKITIYCSVATVFRQLVATHQNRKFSNIRLIKLGGEVVRRTDFEAFQKSFSDRCQLSCGLASTEVGAVRQFFLKTNSIVENSRVSCGYEIPDMEVLILDENGNQCPVGQSGEIAIRSRYIASGYWRRPDLTEAAFSVDPQDPLLRTFRMGDLGKIEADGELIHLGRRDHQVKIHGNRVELPEIEVALIGHPSVQDALVKTWVDSRSHTRLITYVTSIDKLHESDEESLRAYLCERLPGYMIPSRFVLLDSMPLLPNGKLDQNALPSPEKNQQQKPTSQSTETLDPNSLQSQLLAIWREVLDDQQLELDDEFVLAGGDSLKLLELIARIEARLQRKLPLNIVTEARTVRAMATMISSSSDKTIHRTFHDFSISIVPLRTTGSGTPLFLFSSAGGTIVPYVGLIQRIIPNRPVYAVAIKIHRILRDPKQTMSQMTQVAHELIREQMPDREIIIGGWSFGGFIAYEVSRIMKLNNEPVLPVLVLDSLCSMTGKSWKSLRLGIGLFCRLVMNFVPFVTDSMRLRAKLKRLNNSSSDRPVAADDFFDAVPSPVSLTFFFPQYSRVLRNYEMQNAGLSVILLSAEGNHNKEERRQEWRSATPGDVEILPVPGHHFSMILEPHLTPLAKSLDSALHAIDNNVELTRESTTEK